MPSEYYHSYQRGDLFLIRNTCDGLPRRHILILSKEVNRCEYVNLLNLTRVVSNNPLISKMQWIKISSY